MKVLFPSSDWASNIGNAFFTEGVKYLLSACNQEVIPTANHSTQALSTASTIITNNLYNYPSEETDLDAIVLAGPMLNKNFENFYGKALRNYRDNGKKIFLVSAGGIEYNRSEINLVRKLLNDIKPDLLWTRDDETFELYGDLAEYSIKGICAAYFCNEFYPGYDTKNLKNNIILTFDTRAEPSPTLISELTKGKGKKNSSLVGKRSKLRRVFSIGKSSSIDNKVVIRPTHRPASNPWTYALQKNTFMSYTPWGYLNLYRNAHHVLTDRLHAAVASISYGTSVNLFLNSPRAKLLDPINANINPNGLIEYDYLYLSQRKEQLQQELRKFFVEQYA